MGGGRETIATNDKKSWGSVTFSSHFLFHAESEILFIIILVFLHCICLKSDPWIRSVPLCGRPAGHLLTYYDRCKTTWPLLDKVHFLHQLSRDAETELSDVTTLSPDIYCGRLPDMKAPSWPYKWQERKSSLPLLTVSSASLKLTGNLSSMY